MSHDAAVTTGAPPSDRVEHLVLVGMMGSGKSTVGRIIAERLGWRFVDSDAMIEETTGRSIREIFATDGEAAFRALETETLAAALASTEPVVIAAAGGVVLRAENRAALKTSASRVVWLLADPAVLLERVRAGMHRPLLDDDPAATLQQMWAEREALYREVADAVVSVDGRSIGEVVDAVLR